MFDLEDVSQSLSEIHREVMLDIVLAWASIDGAVGVLLGDICGLAPSEAAELLQRESTSSLLRQIVTGLRTVPAGMDASKKMARQKRVYEKHSEIRHYIVHSKCVGYLRSDPSSLVFLKFAPFAPGQMRADIIPFEKFEAAKAWGEAFSALLLGAIAINDPGHVSAAGLLD